MATEPPRQYEEPRQGWCAVVGCSNRAVYRSETRCYKHAHAGLSPVTRVVVTLADGRRIEFPGRPEPETR